MAGLKLEGITLSDEWNGMALRSRTQKDLDIEIMLPLNPNLHGQGYFKGSSVENGLDQVFNET